MKTLTLKVPDGLFAEIASAARARNVSKSHVIRERLTQKRAEAQKGASASLWSRIADVVIQHDPLPSDLSSNKAHLKRYGKSRSHR
jgi:hypothetical protein